MIKNILYKRTLFLINKEKTKANFKLFYLIFFLFGSINLYATNISNPTQQIEIKGVVNDVSGQPLLGAAVLEKGTSNGVQTDFDGNYLISVSDANAILVVSYLGFATQEISVNGQSAINITLLEDTSLLDEVVVVGYGTQKREDVTGAYASIKSEDIVKRPIVSAEQALQGKIPGLQIGQPNGSPGELGDIYIRGIKNLSTGTNPLFVIDGFTTEDQRIFQAINPSDIEAIDILKDASATAIYGSRGANGVIIVTTKQGKRGQPRFNVSVIGGVSSVPNYKRPKLLNAAEYVQFYRESYTNRGLDFNTDAPEFIRNWDGVTDTDWVDEILQTGTYQNYSISASGANEKSSYLISANYTNQEGVIKGEGFEKFSARLKTDFKPIDQLEIGITLAPNYNIQERAANPNVDRSLYPIASLAPPTIPVRDSEGVFTNPEDLGGLINPLEVIQNDRWTTTRFRLISQAYAAYEIIEGLTLQTNIGVTLGNDIFQIESRPSGLNRGNANGIYRQENRNSLVDWQNENTLTYKKVIGDHSFDAVAGYTLQRTDIDGSEVSANNFILDGPSTLNFAPRDNRNARTSKTATSIESFLGRINYAYKDKYLLTASIRRDGSSRFGSNNKYATFKSGAIGWKFSEESFMENVSVITSGKIRASYGESGNNLINNFEWRPNLAGTNALFGNTVQGGVRNANPGNINLTWETAEQVNIGLDLALFDHKVNITYDYFKNNTSGLLLKRPLLPSTSFADVTENIGSMESWGHELSVNATVVESEDFTLNLGGNVSYNDNEVTNLGDSDNLQNFWGVFKHEVGHEFDQIQTPELIGVAREGDGTGLTPGEPIWRDLNNDGSISNFLGPDSRRQGSPTIHWIYGFNLSAQYKDFELTALLQGQAGQVIQDFYITQIAQGANDFNLLKEAHFDGRYIDESNPGNGQVPFAGFHGLPGSPASVSSFGLQKTDYLRIRNVTLNYHLPSSFLDKIGLGTTTIYATVENLYTFTKFKGGNPDSRRAQGGPFGGARITGGTQYGLTTTAYQPLPTTLSLGVNLNL